MNEYRAPYLSKESRKPLLVWPRQVPIAGSPKSNADLLKTIGDFKCNTKMPALLLYADPGVIVPRQVVKWYEDKITNIETAFSGQGLHFIQEDQPDALGLAIADWLRRQKQPIISKVQCGGISPLGFTLLKLPTMSKPKYD